MVNFTLRRDLASWSRAFDFDISENLRNDSYVSNKEVEQILKSLAK